MKMSFRWYGRENDPISLNYIQQIPSVEEIVWALHQKKAGELWTDTEIKAEISYIESFGLKATIVESLNIHEDIKLGLPSRDKYIDIYKKSLENLGKNGVRVICYNFMPIFDWTRTDMFHPLADGSTALYFDKSKISSLSPQELVELVEKESNGLTLPGWEPERLLRIKKLFNAYENMDDEKLRNNFSYFINAIMPSCEKFNVKMAIHPDDPPFPIFNLPRLVNSQSNIEKLLACNSSLYNGLTFCTGSLGAVPTNDLIEMIKNFSDRIHFMHVRNVKVGEDGSFSEVSHRTLDGTVDITGVMATLESLNFEGGIRPDHGRHIFGENETNVRPGYGLYDRALGVMYLLGSWDMAKRLRNHK